MLYNKNNVRKTNDKKILHKVGKQWKVVSVALLMAIGGGAAVAATNNTNANAAANNGVTATTSAEANSLEAMNNYANPYAKQSASSVAPKSVAKAPSFANISYAPSARVAGNNASAASYHNNDNFDKANMHYYGPIVNSYVNSINARFPEARSLAASYNNASGKAANENSMANSYSATANAKSTSAEISARAQAAHQTTSDYTDSVAYNVLHGYMPAVSNAASTASEDSVVTSDAALISEIDANPVLSAEYQDKYTLLNASAYADSVYADDEASIANVYNANSAANAQYLADNRDTLNNLSLGAEIAGINSQVDADYVNGVASAAGFSYTSSVVSSAVSEIASERNNNANVYTLANTAEASFAGNKLSNGTYNGILFEASGQSVASNAKPKSALISLGSSDMYRVISDTAAQQAYASSASSLENAINKESLAVSSYNVQVSSANAAKTSAEVVFSESASARNAASILANNPTMENLFGTPYETTSTTVNSEVASQVVDNATVGVSSEDMNVVKADINAFLANYQPKIMSKANSEVNAKRAAAQNDINKANSAISAAKLYDSVNKSNKFAAQIINSQNKVNAANAQLKNFNNTTLTNKANGMIKDLSGKLANSLNGVTNKSDIESKIDSVLNNDATLNKYNLTPAANSKVASEVNGAVNNISVNAIKQIVKNVANPKTVTVPTTATSTSVSYGNTGLLNASDYAAASADLGGIIAEANGMSNASAVSLMASAANSAASNYNSVSSASASYSAATDQDVTIASQFANYYGSMASSDANSASAALNSLNSFYGTHANNPASYSNASSVYQSASAAEPNDADLAHAFGINVLNHSPKYITVTKNAMLHDATNYSAKNAVMSVKKGDQFAVKGVGFDAAGNIRYVVSTKNNKNYYLTANDSYVENTYLTPGVNYSFKLAKNAMEHANLDFTGKATPVAAGTVVKGVAVRADNYYEGITRLQLANGNYITTNDHYVSDLSVANNNSSNNSSANYTPVQNHLVNF